MNAFIRLPPHTNLTHLPPPPLALLLLLIAVVVAAPPDGGHDFVVFPRIRHVLHNDLLCVDLSINIPVIDKRYANDLRYIICTRTSRIWRERRSPCSSSSCSSSRLSPPLRPTEGTISWSPDGFETSSTMICLLLGDYVDTTIFLLARQSIGRRTTFEYAGHIIAPAAAPNTVRSIEPPHSNHGHLPRGRLQPRVQTQRSAAPGTWPAGRPPPCAAPHDTSAPASCLLLLGGVRRRYIYVVG